MSFPYFLQNHRIGAERAPIRLTAHCAGVFLRRGIHGTELNKHVMLFAFFMFIFRALVCKWGFFWWVFLNQNQELVLQQEQYGRVYHLLMLL